MPPYSVRTAILLLLSISITGSHAFVLPPTSRKTSAPLPVASSSTTTRLFGMTRRYNDGGGGDDGFDIEAARKQLEGLVAPEEQQSSASSSSNNNNNIMDKQRHPDSGSFRWHAGPSFSDAVSQDIPTSLDIVLPPAPPLTTIERQRRQAELQLLAALEAGDEVLSALWALWFQERGPEAAKRLEEAEELTGQGPESWDKAEQLLRGLIDKYGVYWAEPVNRLATLHYMQGRFQQAETLCKIVLAVKPWHFGALSGIVMVYAGRHNVEAARHWAARRLPVFAPAGSNRRRTTWVQKAVADAQDSLFCAESRLKDVFGEQDQHAVMDEDSPPHFGDDDDDDTMLEDAWQ